MNVLFIGLGGIGQRHLRALNRVMPEARIFAVRNRGKKYEITDTMQVNNDINIESKYNIKVLNTINEATANNIDCAIVANPTSLHIETALELVGNNIPVLLEKPISNTDAKVDELITLSLQNNTPVMIGYMMRFHPCMIHLEEYIKKQKLGNIYNRAVDVNSYMPSWHKYEKYNSFYAGKKNLGGGVVLTEIHEIDLISHLFGMPKNLYAVGGKRSSLDLDVEDTVNILMEYEKEDNNFAVTINMSFVQHTPLRRFQVFGENGNILWDIYNNKIKLTDYVNDFIDEYEYSDFDRNHMFKDQILYFIESVKNKTKPITSIENVISSHRIAMDIKKILKDKRG